MYSSSLFQSLYTSKSSQYKLDTIVSHFLDLLQMKSRNLYEHAIRVSNHSAATAVYMRLPTDDIRLIRYAGLLHDIGLLCVPNSILDKAPYLSRRELQLYKKHPDLGANMLESCPGCQELIPYIR
ncbi:MAG: HDIG domain-containing protein, partial [Dialister sp.]|nr:HDIG domain-containing protein [Dialister sp.]